MARSDELVKKQRKLTTAANTIVKELLTYTADKELLTDEEVKHIRETVEVLRNIKQRFVHKKEKAKRQEAKVKREEDRLLQRNRTIAKSIVRSLGFKSRIALSLVRYSYQPSIEGDLTAYEKELLKAARTCPDSLDRLLHHISTTAASNIVDNIIPKENKFWESGFVDGDWEEYAKEPVELTRDEVYDKIKSLSFSTLTQEVLEYMDEVEKLIQLKGDVTERLQSLFSNC